MAIQQPPRTPIILPVCDVKFGDTFFKQKAHFQQLTHTESPAGVCEATITVAVLRYAADGTAPDGFGDVLPDLPARTFTLQAKNDTLVDLATGKVLASSTEPDQNPYDWDAKFTSPTMLQGDYFALLRDTQAVNIGELIRQYIRQADELGRFQ